MRKSGNSRLNWASSISTAPGIVPATTPPLAGAAGWHPALFAELAQSHALDIHTAKHLAHAYGDRARTVLEVRATGFTTARLISRVMLLQLARSSKLGAPLVPGHAVLEAEVVYAARHEFCATASDFLARRSRLAFLDVAAAKQVRRDTCACCLRSPTRPARRRYLVSSSSWAMSCDGTPRAAAARLRAQPLSWTAFRSEHRSTYATQAAPRLERSVRGACVLGVAQRRTPHARAARRVRSLAVPPAGLGPRRCGRVLHQPRCRAP